MVIKRAVRLTNGQVVINGPRSFMDYHILRNKFVQTGYSLIVMDYIEVSAPMAVIDVIVEFCENPNAYNSVQWILKRIQRKYGFKAAKV